MKDYSGQWFFPFCESGNPLRSRKPGTFFPQNMPIHTHVGAYGLRGSGPSLSPPMDFLMPPGPLTTSYLIQHPLHLCTDEGTEAQPDWGGARLNSQESKFPNFLLNVLWLLERPCLALGDPVTLPLPPLLKLTWLHWADEATDPRAAQS